MVDYRGQEIFCQYVQPTLAVTDYRTSQTGIQPDDLRPGACPPALRLRFSRF